MQFKLLLGGGGVQHEADTLRFSKEKAIHAVRFIRKDQIQTQCGSWLLAVDTEKAYDSKYAPTCRKCLKWYQRIKKAQ